MPLEDGEWDETQEPSTTTTPTAEDADLGVESQGPGGNQTPPTEPQPTAQTEESDSEGADEAPEEFDPKVRMDFEGLLYLGKLERQFDWLGHRFVIRTLRTGDLLEVGMLASRYQGTMADAKAYQTAIVAACVVSVDGKSLPLPLTNEEGDTKLRNAFDYIRRSWFPPTLDAVYQEFLLLEQRVDAVIQAMAKAHG